MSSAPSTSVANDVRPTPADIRELKDKLRLELPLKKPLNGNPDILSLLKSTPSIAEFEKFFTEGTVGTPVSVSTPLSSFLQQKEVSFAQQQYAQGFLDALQHVHRLHSFIPTPGLLNSPSLVPQLLNSLGTPANPEQAKLATSPLKSPSRDQNISVIMAMSSMSNLYHNFPPLPSTLAYPASQPPVVPSTSTVTSVSVTTKTEPIRPSSASVKDNYYEMYAGDSNNDAETCSSTRSNASPRSQDEQNLMIGSFSSDQYVDIAEQEKRKLERKRARNRLAATKCRQRKMQKISDLEKEVREIQIISNEKAQKLKELESTVEKLRHLVHEHRNHGCPLPPPTK